MILDSESLISLRVIREELDTYPIRCGHEGWGDGMPAYLTLPQSTDTITIHDLHKVVLTFHTVRCHDVYTIREDDVVKARFHFCNWRIANGGK